MDITGSMDEYIKMAKKTIDYVMEKFMEYY